MTNNKKDTNLRTDIYTYDKEWITLMIQAKQNGLSPKDVRNFLKEKSFVKL